MLFAIAFGVILKATFEIELSSFIATSALVSVVLGLPLQDTLGNLFAGLSLQAENPFVVGDWIQTPDYVGRIVEVAWRGVKIETRRLELITIPNNMLARGGSVNLSRQLDGPVCRDLFVHVDRGVPSNLVRAEIFAGARQRRASAQDILFNQKQYEDALGFVSEAVKIDPNNSWYLDLYGTLLGGIGNYKEAIRVYQQMVQLDPENTDAWFNWAFSIRINKQMKR